MIFVSKYRRLRIPILNEKKEYIAHNDYHEPVWKLVMPHFTAEFAPTPEGGPALIWRDRLAAMKHFAGPGGHLFAGSAPSADALGGEAGYSDQVGEFDASHEEWLLGVFDTESEKSVPADLAEFRGLIEKRLCEVGEATRWQDFVKIGVAVLDPPWPKYEDTHHNQIAGIVESQGYNVVEVLAYEKARDKPRPSVVEQLAALAAKQSAEKADQAALEVTIGG